VLSLVQPGPARDAEPSAYPAEPGLADVVTLQRRRAAGTSTGDEQGFFLDTLAEYEWARDVAGLAASTLDRLVKPVVEICGHYGVAAWRLSPRQVDKYFAGPGKRGRSTVRQKLNLLDSYFAFLEDFQRHARDHHWQAEVRRLAARTLRIVLAWVGADAPIPEADIRSLPADRPGTSARRVVQFLAERNLLVPDPARQLDPDERFVEQRIRSLPADIGAEARRWVEVLRGEGRRAHPMTSFETIRKYVTYVHPALQGWADHRTSLREITPNDVQDVLREQTGNPARSLHTALRSLFRALKRERLVFRDPTRGITLPNIKQLPAPIPTDRLRGLIDRADGPMAQLAVALVAVHGLGPLELTRLHIADLDLARGRLLVRHDTWRRTLYLDELTLGLAASWLRERQRRWPVTANPHLLVSQQTVVMDNCPAISRLAISLIFRRLGLAPSKLRQDRILDEADQTADPVQLMQVFGISARTAVHYVYAAHPERRSTLPR
jgi:integrase